MGNGDSIVLQLQRDSLDKSVGAADLLRKSLVVATKLKLKEFQDWIEKELNGYADEDDIPPYRTILGEVVVFNPYRGWQPVIISNPEQAERLTRRKCWQPIAEVEAWAMTDRRKVPCK